MFTFSLLVFHCFPGIQLTYTVHISEQNLKGTEIGSVASESHSPRNSHLHKWKQPWLVPTKMKG